MQRRRKRSSDYRSGAEVSTAKFLDERGIRYEYESVKLPYTSGIKGGICLGCGGQVVQKRVYLPDFWLPDLGIYIEVKGRLDSPTRRKMRDVKSAHPDKDIRLLLLANNKITPNKPERYADWCEKFGYIYAIKTIPTEWLINNGTGKLLEPIPVEGNG